VTIDWKTIEVKPPDTKKLLPLLDELQFYKIRERLEAQDFIPSEKISKPGISAVDIHVIQINT
jgi:DNA polymerase-1